MTMEDAGAVGAAAWSTARGWLTPAVLLVAINLVIAAIAVASRLMSPASGGEAEAEAAGERRWGLLLRAPSFLARSSLSFSRLGLAAPDHPQQHVVVHPRPRPLSGDGVPERSSPQQPAAEIHQNRLETERHHQREEAEARIERSRSEAAAAVAPGSRRRPRRAAAAAAEDLDGHRGGEEEEAAAAVVEVDARADDFIRRFREQLRLQRLDSILRYRVDRDRDSLRRTGTA